ncbi:MAG: hypothetical protein EON59_07280 [Alphaproteobacteria bacterium]|nr:MAG: hypothetical protein EON59_07280 [Alphaproteobacteria bacterium]
MNIQSTAPEKSGPITLGGIAPFAIGAVMIQPSRLTLIGPAGEVSAEPRVMQVLIALSEAGGDTVTRENLMERCWSGMTVGDDSLNRAIGELRRVMREAGADWTVDTVPRIGYRINNSSDDTAPVLPAARLNLDRRRVLAGSAALTLAAAAGIVWIATGRPRRNAEVETLIAEGRQALREQLPYRNRNALVALGEAASKAPEDAEVLGLLAIAWRDEAEFASAADASAAARNCEAAARRALAIDAAEPNALAALATLQPFYGDWIEAERRILNVLEAAPESIPALSVLTTLYQSSGYLGESRKRNDQALKLDPLSPVFQFRAALKHWIDGDLSAADLQIDRTIELWPRHPAVWNARLMLFAYTGRAAAGLQFLNNAEMHPTNLPKPALALWSAVLSALSGDRNARGDARPVATAAALAGVPGVPTAIMYLSYAGQLDAAFDVANGFFLRRGPLAASGQAQPKVSWVTDQSWRRSMMLFTPATESMRNDPRFEDLARGMGLANFWKERGKGPDFRTVDARR